MPLASDLYPALADVLPALTELGANAGPVSVPTGSVLFDENAPCRGFPLVLEGEIKVSRHSGDGRSLELYRVVPGETPTVFIDGFKMIVDIAFDAGDRKSVV